MLARVSSAPTNAPVPDFFQMTKDSGADPAAELLQGLEQPAASIPPWYFYDTVGSRLFDVITALPDYYPTRTEAALLAEHARALVAARDVTGCAMIDLGAGACDKAPRLFAHVRPRQYVPVDISTDYLRGAVVRLQSEHPEVHMVGVGTDFSRALTLPEIVDAAPRLFFYPGSSIGNFEPRAARDFLQRIRAQMSADDTLWIGVDLVKDPGVLERAYDDVLGVTAAFNRNILQNVNRIVGADFAPATWRHVSHYDESEQRIEMHLEATIDTTVRWEGGERRFAVGERIHTENSYKYTVSSFRQLLEGAGLREVGVWTDERDWFAFFAAAPAA